MSGKMRSWYEREQVADLSAPFDVNDDSSGAAA